VNLKGVFIATRAVVPTMIKQGHGCILSASSVVAAYGNFGQTNYAATKAGLIAMTKTWARELGKYGIRVNAVAPGYVRTHLVEAIAAEGRIDLAALERRTPQGRLGTTEEIADAILYLCEPRAAHVTGQVLAVDGGWTAYGYV